MSFLTRGTLVLAFFVVLNGCSKPNSGDDVPVIPVPLKAELQDGSFTITPATRIYYDVGTPRVEQAARWLQAKLHTLTGFPLELEVTPAIADSVPAIHFQRSKYTELGKEGYQIIADSNQVRIRSMDGAGMFYGAQTLLQLLPPQAYSDTLQRDIDWTVPAMRITDLPRFPWRGAHLDVSRHFFPKEFIKRYIDILAMHKLNFFHWHLTDDQGWRIEIKKYPKLTSVGAWRVERPGVPWNEREPQQEGEVPSYGGFYTQEDIREIIAYAESRFVTIVPEIEMPAHAVAALAAYPQFSCTGGPFHVMPGGYWPITNILCAGKDSTFAFLEDVLDEVAALFPGKYIHIGGDEAFKDNWKACADCQQRIREHGLKDESELQSYFIRRIEKILLARGKRLIGWDEILEGGLAPEATVMSWRGMKGGIEAAKAGHDVVMTPTSHCYFDYYQGRYGEPPAFGNYLPLEKVYEFEPIPEELNKDQRWHILGAQANLWTEYMPTTGQVEYMLMPRIAALAEVVWSAKEKRDLPDFQKRLQTQFQRYIAAGYNFRVPPPEIERVVTIFSDSARVEPGIPCDGCEIRTEEGPFGHAFTVHEDTSFTIHTRMPGGRRSHPVTQHYFRVDPDRNGLLALLYEGRISSLAQLDSLQETGSETVFYPDPANMQVPENWYALRFRGFLQVPVDGEYVFTLVSDDGSRLYLGAPGSDQADILLIDHDGTHRKTEKQATISLRKGVVPFELLYFQAWGDQTLELYWQPPGGKKNRVPARHFLRTLPVAE